MLYQDYVKRESDLLDKIADTLRELDGALSKMTSTTNEKEREHAENKAMKEIRTFTKQVNRLDNVEGLKQETDEYGTSEAYAKQNQALRDIQALCGNIRETAEEPDAHGMDTKDRQALTDALRNIRQILRMVGKYDDYTEDERDRIIKGV